MAGGGVGLKYFTVRGATLIEGGIPIVVDGGGIGVSGVDAKDDAQIAQAGVDAVK
jgi:glc operon protein GlcG